MFTNEKLYGLDLIIQDRLEEVGKELKGILKIEKDLPHNLVRVQTIHLTTITELVSIVTDNSKNFLPVSFTIENLQTETDTNNLTVIVYSTELCCYMYHLVSKQTKIPSSPPIFEEDDLQELHAIALDLEVNTIDTDNYNQLIEELNTLVYKTYIRLT